VLIEANEKNLGFYSNKILLVKVFPHEVFHNKPTLDEIRFRGLSILCEAIYNTLNTLY